VLWAKWASFLMGSGVLLGAFGSHALKGKIEEHRFSGYQTAVLYQFIHALGLFAVAWLAANGPTANIDLAGLFMIAGIILFSGSLYVWAICRISWLGYVTPFGGVSFLIAWLILFLNIKTV
jgi:uncharacterized membrane protein YgdD (TMEM256/DUF423 family)